MRMISTLRKATKAAGGNLLVVTRLGDRQLMDGDGIVLRAPTPGAP
jgi:hypothetical protein